jgi:hypothetical protein
VLHPVVGPAQVVTSCCFCVQADCVWLDLEYSLSTCKSAVNCPFWQLLHVAPSGLFLFGTCLLTAQHVSSFPYHHRKPETTQ